MIDAVVGAVIMVAATTGLILAVEVGERSISQAGRYPLTKSEIEMLRSAGLENPQNVLLLQADLDALFR